MSAAAKVSAPAACHIRWMIRRDMPEVLRIENLVYRFPWTDDDFVQALRSRSNIGMVAETSGGQVLGYVIYSLNRTKLRILNLAVRPLFAREGIGTALVAKLKGKLSPSRRTRLEADVCERNLCAQLFFKSQGFICDGFVRSPFEDTDEDALTFAFTVEGAGARYDA